VADLRISELPDGTTAQATDVVPIVRAGENYKLPLSALSPAADTQVLFKDGSLVAGSSDFVFDKTLKALASGTDAVTALGKSTKRWAAAYFGGVAAVVPLVVKAHASQTAALQEWQNSSATPLSFLRKDGALQVGPTVSYIASTGTADQALSARFTQDHTYSSGRGIYSEVNHNPASGSSNIAYGIQTTVYGSASGTSTANYIAGIYGLVRQGSSRPYTQITGMTFYSPYISGGTGVVATGVGAEVSSYLDATAVCTTIKGFNVNAPTTVVGYTLANLYGIYVGNMNKAATLNYAIYTAGGTVQILTGGDAVVGLVVQGTASQSANLQEWQASNAAVLAAVTKDGYLKVGANQVVSARKTGWGAPAGTPTRTAFDTTTVTLPQLAERLKALIDDLALHGLIGA